MAMTNLLLFYWAPPTSDRVLLPMEQTLCLMHVYVCPDWL